jgi:hypothetical protein
MENAPAWPVAKYTKDVVASSNFRDIVPYCHANHILYLGTLNILAIALKKNVFDEEQCNRFSIFPSSIFPFFHFFILLLLSSVFQLPAQYEPKIFHYSK